MTAIRSLQTVLLAVTFTTLAWPAQGVTPDESMLVAGATLTYRYAIYDRDLISEQAPETQFGFMSCKLVAVQDAEPGAFRAKCEGGPTDSAITWTPWRQNGYHAWRDDGLYHVTGPTEARLTVPGKPDPAKWASRSILVLGDPVKAHCPQDTEPTIGQSIFEEVCWTRTHGPVFFVGVDTTDSIAEATWELLHVRRPGEAVQTAISRAKAEKLIKGWLWSQNANRLQSYSWLYASVFHGIERGAAGTGSFDRTDWLRKYATVLARKTRVRIEDVKFLSAGDTTIVLFEQHRTLGGQSDHGLRELRLGLEHGRVVISREEMLYALAQ